MSLTNEQYDAIMRTYDRRQEEARRKAQARRQEINEKIPEMDHLDERISRAAFAMARIPKEKRAGEEAEIEYCRQRRRFLLKDAGYPEDYLEDVYACPLCRDTGFIGKEKCRCFKQEETGLYMRDSGLTAILQKENFFAYSEKYYDTRPADAKGNSVLALMHSVYLDCVRYTEEFSGKPGASLLLTGPIGTGKTFFTHCIAAEILRQGYGVFYLTAAELTDIFSAKRFGGEKDPGAEEKYSRVMACDLLILDDLGTEWNNNFTITELFSCLNDRMIHGKSCVISTNLSMKGLQEMYTERVTSRLFGCYKVLQLCGDDLRIKIRYKI